MLRRLDLRRAKLDEANFQRADLGGVHLERASLKRADLWLANLSDAHAAEADLSGANLRDARLRRGDFQRTTCLNDASFVDANLEQANFSGAKMVEANLSGADLTEACFDSADLTDAWLGRAILDGTSFLATKLFGAVVHGAFIRRVQTNDETDQRSLSVDVHVVWERRQKGTVVEFTDADDIRLAQFHDVVEEDGSIAALVSAGTKRVVLILGRFSPRRKRILGRLAAALRDRGKIPVIFDFPGPTNREMSDIVRFVAGMSQFIVVDMTKASSVPLELQATIPDLMVPVLPIVQAGDPVFSMFADLQRRYFWIQRPVTYKDADQLVRYVDKAIIARAKRAADEIEERRAISARLPGSIVGIGRRRRRRKS